MRIRRGCGGCRRRRTFSKMGRGPRHDAIMINTLMFDDHERRQKKSWRRVNMEGRRIRELWHLIPTMTFHGHFSHALSIHCTVDLTYVHF